MTAAMLLGPGLACAQDRLIRFHIPAKSTRDALLDLALQADVLLGGDVDACGGASNPISGRMTVKVALGRLLEGGACTFSLNGPNTIVIHRITARPAAVPASQPSVRRAEPAAPPPVLESAVSEIVVTGQRRADLAGRAPLSMSALSKQQLADTGAVDMNSLSTGVAGMTVTNLGPGRDKVLLRGLSDGVFTGVAQSTVGLYLDDVPITYNAPDPDLRLVDVERVEVLRGPQGTLYGEGSMGGIIRIVTRKPDLDQWSASMEGEASTTRSGNPSTEAEAVINAPIVKGRIGLRVVGYSERDGGYIDDTNLGLKNVNNVTRDGVRLSLRAALTPNWSLDIGALHQSINSDDTQYVFKGGARLRRANQVREPHDNDFDALVATVEGEIPWGHVTASSERLLHQLDDRFDASDALPEFGRPPGVAQFDEGRRIELFVNEITFASAQQGRLRWLAGVFQSIGETDFTGDLSRRGRISGLPRLGYTEDRVDKIDEEAVYGEATYDLASRLTVTAGARWFRYAYSIRSTVAQGASTRVFEGQGQAGGWSPKIVLRYQATARAMIYGQIAEGFRPGGFNTSGVIGQQFDGSPDNPARAFDPDHLWNFELGAKLQLWRDRVQLRLAAFYARWDGIQTDQFLKSGLPYTANVGDGANLGFEVEAGWRATDRLQLWFAGLIDDPQVTKTSAAFAARPDAGLPGVPNGSASAGLSYRRPISSQVDLLLNAEAAYTGISHLTFDALKIYDMGGYTTGRLSAAIDTPGWRMTVFVDNPFDTEANTFAFGDPFRIGRAVEATPLRPRTMGVRLGVHF